MGSRPVIHYVTVENNTQPRVLCMSFCETEMKVSALGATLSISVASKKGTIMFPRK